jgi:hypothetical protein
MKAYMAVRVVLNAVLTSALNRIQWSASLYTGRNWYALEMRLILITHTGFTILQNRTN